MRSFLFTRAASLGFCFVALLSARPALGQDYAFTTLAGAAGYGSNAQLNNPLGVAVDSNGNVFVADTDNHTIRRVTADGVVTTLAGSTGNAGSADGTGSAARFNFPTGVAVDFNGNVFVADSDHSRIRKITADGVVTTLGSSGNSSGSADGTSSFLYRRPGVAVDASGNVFVADPNTHTIRTITPAGVATTLAGAAGSTGRADGTGSAARFEYPLGIAVDSSGNVFVIDGYGYRIRKISADAVVTTLPGFFWASGLAVDRSGNVFVAEGGWDEDSYPHHSIRKITPDGVITTIAGSDKRGSADGTGSAARFFGPLGVAVDSSGNAFIADSGNHAIRKINPAGVVTTFAGDITYGSTDGGGGDARFSSPHAVAVDGSGTVFVADTRNSTIRKIGADGVVTTLAGLAGSAGSADGTGRDARFNNPGGVAVDASGNVFIADTYNFTIRKITSAGVVTTLAGLAGSVGRADGTGNAARFGFPCGVAVDGTGNVFVADLENNRIRKITANGVVTTLAGPLGRLRWVAFPRGVTVDASGNVFVADSDTNRISKVTPDGVGTSVGGAAETWSPAGSADGPGYFAGFRSPRGVAVDSEGNVFVADTGNHTIRKITAAGVVTTIGGTAGSVGSAEGVGRIARFYRPAGVAVDRNGSIYVADTGNGTIRKGVPVFIPPFVVTAPQSEHVNLGARATFTIVADGTGNGYQWKKDGIAIFGATRSIYEIGSAAAGDMGFYSVVVSGDVGTVESPVAILTAATDGTSRLGNFSARGLVPAGGDLTAGFVLRGNGGKFVLVRAIGPTLGSLGVSGALANPRLDVFPASARVATNSNDDWGGGPVLAGAFTSVGAFPLPPTSNDAVVLATLTAAGYTARVTSSLAGGSGIALAEVYDRDPAGAPSRLGNISTLGFVGAGAEAPALGFVIDGTAPKRLLIRAVGPGIAPLGVAGVLGDPQLSVIPLGKTFTVASNDNWGGDAALVAAFVSAGAFALPASSKDAAVVVRLPPGGYTVIVTGLANTTGRALVEIYDLDP